MFSAAEILSKKDCFLLLEIVNSCVSCSNVTEAGSIANKTRDLIGFDHAVYGLAKLNHHGCITAYETLNFSYPAEWLDAYRTNNFHLLDPITTENFKNYSLQYWKDTFNTYDVEAKFLSAALDFRLVDGYAIGITNSFRTEGCIFSISGPIKKEPRNELVLNLLAPHLHQAFRQVLSVEKKGKISTTITIREREVLNWIKKGKSSWDISTILAISERTVKFHVDNVMRKLDAVSRIHAVAVALSVGLIDID
ncbi:LuxR family transcriptional regulator [Geotalea uraniireducens]|uniref:Transcriptional regulator, LuxR family n=1 Tax=Geotalea uraniireducens (strain Rf4) TaxID=351605 RepID=A5G659_GEOUR|nr:LuxR family transcriptional regulator [Geotalea uraniireducens]ABQ27277.1 transcriptional regulator, LuxR family [Geotalea uraniireducens Rf4]